MPKVVESRVEPVARPIPSGADAPEIVGSYDLHPFRMVSDARARRVARDLRDLLKAEGITLGLTRCQAVTAAIYGYATWRDLTGDLGQDYTPDDPFETELEVAARGQRALRALSTVVPSMSVAARILMALRPTDRAGLADDRALLVELRNANVYHPVRLRRLIDESEPVERATEDLEADPSDAYADIDPVEMSGLAGLRVIEQSVADDELKLLPYDAYAVLQRRILPLYAAARRLETALCRIVDAESVALALAERTIGDLAFPVDHYVHLGASRFPSPYPGLGIEGCYVRSCPDGDIVVSAVISPPSFGDDPEAFLDLFDADAMLMAHGRGHTMRLVDIVDGGLSVALAPYADALAIGAFDGRGRPPYAAGLDGLWRTFLRPAAAAAVNAVLEAHETPIARRVIGVTLDVAHPFARRIAKARTAPQAEAAWNALEADQEGMAVVLLGRMPVAAETGYLPDALPDDAAFWPTLHAETWLALFLAGGTPDFDFGESADLVFDYARHVAPDRARYHALSEPLRAGVLKAAVSYLDQLVIVEDWPAVIEVADEMLALETPEAARFRAYKATALIQEGSFAGAEALVADLAVGDRVASGWFAYAVAKSRGDAATPRLLRMAFEADTAFAEAVSAFLGEGLGEDAEDRLAQSGIARNAQLLRPLIDDIQAGLRDLQQSLRLAPRTSASRH